MEWFIIIAADILWWMRTRTITLGDYRGGGIGGGGGGGSW